MPISWIQAQRPLWNGICPRRMCSFQTHTAESAPIQDLGTARKLPTAHPLLRPTSPTSSSVEASPQGPDASAQSLLPPNPRERSSAGYWSARRLASGLWCTLVRGYLPSSSALEFPEQAQVMRFLHILSGVTRGLQDKCYCWVVTGPMSLCQSPKRNLLEKKPCVVRDKLTLLRA